MLVSKSFQEMKQNPQGSISAPTERLWTFPARGESLRSVGEHCTAYVLAVDSIQMEDADFIEYLKTRPNGTTFTQFIKDKDPTSYVSGPIDLGTVYLEKDVEGLTLNIMYGNDLIKLSNPITHLYVCVTDTATTTNLIGQNLGLIVRLDINDLDLLDDTLTVVEGKIDTSSRPLTIQPIKLI